MRSRIKLHELLVGVLGSRYVYFQPPESLKLTYPCIIYERHDISNTFADDDVYLDPRQYRVTVVDPDPDSEIVNKMAKFKTPRFVRHMVVDNLNHDIFNIYY
jgi:hypothetical protein